MAKKKVVTSSPVKSTGKKTTVKPMTESEKLRKFEKDLWDVACKLWTNTNLKPVDYKIPVLALIFLRFADQKFAVVEANLVSKSSRRDPSPDDFKAKGVVYLAPEARWDYLKSLSEGSDVGAAINKAMTLIEDHNEDLKGILPKTFNRFRSEVILSLMRVFHGAQELDGDNFGRIYEFFMSEFEKDSGQKGGEFFTPPSIVKLIVEIIEPYHGKIYDPACGSGGMFAQSAKFVEAHKKRPSEELAAFGQEKTAETIKIAKMNLAISGFSGTIKSGNSYYDDEHKAVGKFDFVMANPPFNASGVDKDRIKDDKKRFPFGMPSIDNANYLWVQLFYSSLNETGRAGFVMGNSASDARSSELDIRKQIINSGAVDVIVSVSRNFFYTVTLPVTLWFLDKGKPKDRKDKVLFIDAKNIFTQVNRTLREYSTEQLEFVANIVRAYRGEALEFSCDNANFKKHFPDGKYSDVKGLCSLKSIKDIEEQGWSLNPSRYIEPSDSDTIEFDSLPELIESVKIKSTRISQSFLNFNTLLNSTVIEQILNPELTKIEDIDLPLGWNVRRLKDLAVFISRGISPKYDDSGSAPYRVINQKCIRDGNVSLLLARGNTKAVTENKLVKKWDILVNSTGVGTLGRVAQVNFEMNNLTVDSHVTIVRPNSEIDPVYLGAYCLTLQSYFESCGQGATGQTELGRERIGEALVVVPPQDVQLAFKSLVLPILELTSLLQEQLKLLPSTRDTLLQGLLSGSFQITEKQEIK